jgi:hypothetical protein
MRAPSFTAHKKTVRLAVQASSPDLKRLPNGGLYGVKQTVNHPIQLELRPAALRGRVACLLGKINFKPGQAPLEPRELPKKR